MAFFFADTIQFGYAPQQWDWYWDATWDLSTTQYVSPTLLFTPSFAPTKQIIPTQHQVFFANDITETIYGRMLITPTYINTGTIQITTYYTVDFWNADLNNQRVLNSVGLFNAAGIEFQGASSYPFVFKTMQTMQGLIKVDNVGPASINATITYNFGDFTASTAVVGSRLFVFYWVPKQEYTEKLDWLTDILEAYSYEQRLALRIAPRRNITYQYIKSADAGMSMQNFARKRISQKIGAPIWFEATKVGVIQTGATTISLDTTTASYDTSVFIWESDSNYEAANIKTIQSNLITIDQPIKNNYTNAFVMPLYPAIVQDGISFVQNYNSVSANISFIIVDEKYLGENIFGTYDGYPVIDTNVMVQSINQRIYQDNTYIDNGQGLIEVSPNRSIIEKTSLLGKVVNNNTDLWRWRKFLHYIQGRTNTFLLPTFQNDILPQTLIVNGIPQIRVKELNLTQHGDFPIRTQLVLNNGNIYYAKIISSSAVTGSTDEIITLDNAFSFDIQPADIKRWSFVDLVRFDADSVTLEYTGKIVKCSIPVKVVKG